MSIGSGFGKVNSLLTFNSSYGRCCKVPSLHEEFFIIVGFVILTYPGDV
jgi:hypothetical protein